jgi:hypothetical protein
VTRDAPARRQQATIRAKNVCIPTLGSGNLPGSTIPNDFISL